MKIEDYFEQKKQETNKCFAFFVKKVPHSEECPYGIDICSDFDPDKPLVLLLAGTSDKRDVLRACNSLLKKTENFIFGSIPSAKKNLLLCAAVCHFGKYFNPDMARRLLYLYHKDYPSYMAQFKNFDEEEQVEYAFPEYVSEIYAKILLPRICDRAHNLLPFDIALRRLRKLTVIAYCHGAYTWMKIEEQLNLLLMGDEYSNRQKKRLLKSITVLASSPDCPLGYSKTQFISVASASDLSIQHGNGFIRYVHRNIFVEDFGLSYWGGSWGKVFYCAQYAKGGVEGNPRVLKRVDPQVWYENLHQQNSEQKKSYIYEHDFLGFSPYPNMSNASLKLQRIAMSILMNAIENSSSNKPKQLSVFDLIGGWKHNFWAFLMARINGFIILLRLCWWARNPHQYSFADNVRFVSMD